MFFLFLDIKITSIRQIAKLRDSPLLKDIIAQVQTYSKKLRISDDIKGPVEADPEYQLIVHANNLAVDMDTEMGK